MLQVAAYIRVSTDEQAEQGISIPAQKSRLAAYCKSQGWDIYDFYIDDGYSGKDLERPAMQNLIGDAMAGKLSIVLVYKLDRLSRRQKDVLHLLEDVFEPHGMGFKSATEPFDTTTPYGKASLGMMAVFAQLERETIIERVKMAKRELAKQGHTLGGPAPYGYTYNYDKKLIEINEIQAATVMWIYNAYLSGVSGYQSIAEALEEKGVPGPTNQRWIKQSVRKILTSPVYAGLIAHSGNLYPGKHEGIVSVDTWQKAQALIKGRGAIRSFAAVHDALLSGIIYCGECGARMRVKNVWQNHPCTDPKKVIRYYVCYSQDGSAKHMVRRPGCRCGYKHADEVEEKVIQRLFEYSFSEGDFKQIANELLSEKDDSRSLIRGLNQVRNELSSIDKKLERWYNAFEKGALEPDELVGRVKDLKSRKKHLQEQLTQWNEQIVNEKQRQVSAADLLDKLRNFPSIWRKAVTEEQRGIIANLIKAVRVYEDGHVGVEFNVSTWQQP